MTTPTAVRKKLRAHALKHPEAWADEPWPGDHVVKVGKKIFVFLGGEGPEVGLGVKLPRSLLFARAQTFVQKMGYGMDKSGWVAVRFSKDEEIPLELLLSWIDESYETVAAAALPKGKRTTPLPKSQRAAPDPKRKRAAAPKRKAAAKRR